jgi:hypothetical protein
MPGSTNGQSDDGSKPNNGNIQAAQPGVLQWKSDTVPDSLNALVKYVEAEADNAIRWYWSNKKWKARLSRWIRLWALLFTAAAGLLPVVSYIARESGWCAGLATTSGLWASALVGVAAGLLGMDRAFGFSSGWARYVLAATEIRKKLEEFRMDWIAQTATAGATPNADQVAAFIQKAKEFRVAVEGIVAEETKDWVTEFQTNMAQMEKDVKAQLDSLKAQVDKAQEARQAATQPGSIEATIDNADKARDFAFSVTVEGPDGDLVKDDPVKGSKTWARVNIKPGLYRLVVTATAPDNKLVSATAIVAVKPGERGSATISLPIA